MQPPTLQRVFARARSNNRNRVAGNNGWSMIAPAQSACQPGSRWSKFAFTADDEGSTFSVEENDAGGFNLYVDDLLRTQTDTFDLDAMDLIDPDFVPCETIPNPAGGNCNQVRASSSLRGTFTASLARGRQLTLPLHCRTTTRGPARTPPIPSALALCRGWDGATAGPSAGGDGHKRRLLPQFAGWRTNWMASLFSALQDSASEL